ncbi:hypothetical protein [Streptomyces mirabilis]|uniref:hypothetical protein n=1 Tax=Streptomyces mirabilis TaxID=68239 RepID=UPI002E2863E4|nr:hypothetical protein [Streptomyces mirabilis]
MAVRRRTHAGSSARQARSASTAVGIFQQDRWSNGSARGLTATYSLDGRHFTETPLPFLVKKPERQNYEEHLPAHVGRLVSTGPDGAVYARVSRGGGDIGSSSPDK